MLIFVHIKELIRAKTYRTYRAKNASLEFTRKERSSIKMIFLVIEHIYSKKILKFFKFTLQYIRVV